MANTERDGAKPVTAQQENADLLDTMTRPKISKRKTTTKRLGEPEDRTGPEEVTFEINHHITGWDPRRAQLSKKEAKAKAEKIGRVQEGKTRDERMLRDRPRCRSSRKLGRVVELETHRILVWQQVLADAEKVLAVLSQSLDESFLQRQTKGKTISIHLGR